MQTSIQSAVRLIEKLTKEQLDQDEIRYAACLYRIIIVAEAARGLPSDITSKAPEVPWRNLIGMGNNLKHQYFRVESDVVWDTIVNHFPVLLKAVERLLLDERARLETV